MDSIVKGLERYMDNDGGVNMLQYKQAIVNVSTIIVSVFAAIAWALTMGIILVTAIDVMYLTIPIFRNFVSDKNLHARGRFRIVSYDAEKALDMAAMNESASPLKYYMKMRIKVHITVAILLCIILGNTWFNLAQILARIIISIVSVFVDF